MATDDNAEQREFWNGDEARGWVTDADRYDAMLAPFATMLLDAVALGPGDRVLDVGCGNGVTTLESARRVGEGSATGIDLSAPMLEVATARASAQEIDNATFTLGDAQTDTISGQFDAVISRFGIMFFADPVAAFTNIRSTIAPGGRVAFVCWRPMFENEWTLVPTGALLQHLPPPDLPDPTAPGPFRFGDEGSLEQVLSEAGFVDVSGTGVDISMLIGGPGSLDDAFTFASRNTIVRRFLGDAPQEVRERALDAMREAMAAYVTDEGVRMNSAAWLVRARVA